MYWIISKVDSQIEKNLEVMNFYKISILLAY